MRAGFLSAGGIAALVIVGTAGWFWHSHRVSSDRSAAQMTSGEPQRGKETMVSLGCVACHDVPGVTGTKREVGPSLAGFGLRPFVAGAAENTPEKLIQFLRDPRSIAPKSAMPKLKMSEAEARDMAAFLYTLQ